MSMRPLIIATLVTSLVGGSAGSAHAATPSADAPPSNRAPESAAAESEPEPEPETEPYSTRLLAGGLVVTLLGVVAAATGAGVYLSNISVGGGGDQAAQSIGVGLMIGGGVVSIAGIPMMVAGAWSVPVQRRPGASNASLELGVGLGDLVLRGTF